MMSRNGQVCSDYMRKLAAVETKEDLFRVLCDANGGSWLFDAHMKGVPLPIEQFMSEFGGYINGQRVVVYPQEYTGQMYCRYNGELTANTTLVYLLECNADITVPKNSYPSVILSNGSKARFAMEPGARLNIECYGNASWVLSGDMTRVRETKHI